jgi:hypothetical protein
MARVRIRNKRTGREKEARPRDAHILVSIGEWEKVEDEPESKPKPAKPEPVKPEPIKVDADTDFGAMAYNELRRAAAELGINPEGRKAEDYVRALQYHTRALHAED